MNDENLSSAFYQQYSSKLHQRKLEEIKNRKNFTVSSSLEPQLKDAKRPKGFLKTEKMQQMMRENRLLHEKLILISKRKTSIDSIFHSSSPKTLNFGLRKKISDQIMQENSNIIQRILERPARISVKQMKIDYELSQKYKENLSKKKILERIRKIVKKFNLPSLVDPGFEGALRDRRGNQGWSSDQDKEIELSAN